MKYLFIIFSFVYAFSNEPSLEQTHEQNKPDENKTQTQADINNSFISLFIFILFHCIIIYFNNINKNY